MDTLSRKHRLRQQQERAARSQQQHQQQVVYGKENLISHQFLGDDDDDDVGDDELECEATNNNHIYANNNNRIKYKINENNRRINTKESDCEEEEFKVFKVVDIRNNQHQYISSSSSSRTTSSSQKDRSKHVSSGELLYHHNNLHRHSRDSRARDFLDDDRDYSIVCTPTATGDHNDKSTTTLLQQELRIPRNSLHNYTNHNCSTDSVARSTGDSSGFLSEGSSTNHRNHRQRTNYQMGHKSHYKNHQEQDNNNTSYQSQRSAAVGSAFRQQQQKQQQRSKVIDDLDQLMADVLSRSSGSPETESYMSGAESSLRDSTLTRGRELDYSTLCRDEFSGFISVENKLNGLRGGQQLRRQKSLASNEKSAKAGPMLVGVHDLADHELMLNKSYYHNPPSSGGSSSSSTDIEPSYEASTQSADEIRSSSSGLSTATSSTNSSNHLFNEHSSSFDREQLFVNEMGRDLPNKTTSNSSQDDLSQLLDIYMNKIDSIKRLAKGDKTISIDELFNDDDNLGLDIRVEDEFLTQIEFTHLKRENSIKVIQEVQMVEMPLDCGLSQVEGAEQVTKTRCLLATNVINDDFSSKLASSSPVPLCPVINWPPASSKSLKNNSKFLVDTESQMNLEKSLHRSLVFEELSSGKTTVENQYLVNTVKRHLSEFIDNYVTYQNELRRATSFANDWHENWLFSYNTKRPRFEDNNNKSHLVCDHDLKRVKMTQLNDDKFHLIPYSQESGNEILSDHNEEARKQQQVDLIRYSTLILNRCNIIKPRYQMAELCNKEDEHEIDEFYGAEEDRFSELYSSASESKGQLDVCRLLLSDDTVDSRVDKNSHTRDSSNSGLVISYSSSIKPNLSNSSQKYGFSAYGYSIETPISVPSNVGGERLALFRERILLKILNLSSNFNQSPSNSKSSQQVGEEVRFSVNLTSVELTNNLPIIQFCAKVAGSLPISVKWFSCSSDNAEVADEISDISGNNGRRKRDSLRVRETVVVISGDGNKEDGGGGGLWPIEMHANYDYEYRNNWASYYRFRRHHGDLLFEIRDPNLNKDYNKTFKCVIQNHCSSKECSFTLSKRAEFKLEPNSGVVKRCNNLNESQTEEDEENLGFRRKKLLSVKKENGRTRDKHALLRTWSQRTLPRPQLTTSALAEQQQAVDANELDFNEINDTSGNRCWQQTTTLNRRSAYDGQQVVDKFGKDFPYHPENLLKRLEENKFQLISLKCTNPKLTSTTNINSTAQLLEVTDSLPTTTTTTTTTMKNVGDTSHPSHLQFMESFELPTSATDDKVLLHLEVENGHRKLEMENKPQLEQQVVAITPTSVSKTSESNVKPPPIAPKASLPMQQPEPRAPEEGDEVNQKVNLAPKPRLSRTQVKQVSSSQFMGEEPLGGQMSRLNERLIQTQTLTKNSAIRQPLQVNAFNKPSMVTKTTVTSATNTTNADATVANCNLTDSMKLENGQQQQQQQVTNNSEVVRQRKEQEYKLDEECKPRTNVKSLISRFSLA